MTWMETPKPNYEFAKRLADQTKAKFYFSYNLFPRFDWSGADISDKDFQYSGENFGKIGYI